MVGSTVGSTVGLGLVFVFSWGRAGVPNVLGGWFFVVCQNHIIVFMDVVFLSELYEFGHWFWYPKSLDTSSFERLITYTENTVH